MSDTLEKQNNPIISAAKQLKTVKEKIDELKAHTTELQKEYDRLRFQELPDLMVDNELEKLTVTDVGTLYLTCLLYTSPSPRDGLLSRMPSSA